MPAFPKPKIKYDYVLGDEIKAIRQYERTKEGRDIPDRAPNRLLVASWNIANLGVQQRRDKDYALIAQMLGWFDLIALQETNDNLDGLLAIQKKLPKRYKLIYSDAAGNNERMAFVYDATKLHVLEMIGEIGVPPKDLPKIKLPKVKEKFQGFDRNPYLAAFQAGKFKFILINVHLYFGETKTIARRYLEAFAVARWADSQRRSKHASIKDVIAIGDFNLPQRKPGDAVFDALTRKGLKLPDHSTTIGSSIVKDNHYDQIAFYPAETLGDFATAGIFDFDGALFRKLWTKLGADVHGADSKQAQPFYAYMRYYMSDHRILWSQFKI